MFDWFGFLVCLLLLFLLFSFLRQGLSCNLGYSESYYIDQIVFELTNTCLPLPLNCYD